MISAIILHFYPYLFILSSALDVSIYKLIETFSP